MARKYRQLPIEPEAFEYGKIIHKILETYYRNIPNSLTPKEIDIYIDNAIQRAFGLPYNKIESKFKFFKKHFRKFEKFRLTNHLVVEAVELKKERKIFRGIADLVLRSPSNERIILDWKTSSLNSIPDYIKLQGCIYSYIFEANKVIFYSTSTGRWWQISAKDCEEVAEELNQIISLIKSGYNEKKKGDWCKYCEYQIACWFEEVSQCNLLV